jgi:hypothetical protein
MVRIKLNDINPNCAGSTTRGQNHPARFVFLALSAMIGRMSRSQPQEEGLLPRSVRASLMALLAAILTVVAYLMVVRGPAMLLELAANTVRAICF